MLVSSYDNINAFPCQLKILVFQERAQPNLLMC